MELLLILAGVALGLAAAVAVWAARRSSRQSRPGTDGAQEVQILVRRGYVPNRVQVRRERPVRITFDRQEDGECTEWVIFPGMGIASTLPAFRRTVLEFTPHTPGEFEFRCKLGACRGHLIVTA